MVCPVFPSLIIWGAHSTTPRPASRPPAASACIPASSPFRRCPLTRRGHLLAFPDVQRRSVIPVLPAKVRTLQTGFLLTHHIDNLLFRNAPRFIVW